MFFEHLFSVLEAESQASTLFFNFKESLLELFLLREVMRRIPWYTAFQLNKIGVSITFDSEQSAQLSFVKLLLPADMIEAQS